MINVKNRFFLKKQNVKRIVKKIKHIAYNYCEISMLVPPPDNHSTTKTKLDLLALTV